jgi:hypothetical protein
MKRRTHHDFAHNAPNVALQIRPDVSGIERDRDDILLPKSA